MNTTVGTTALQNQYSIFTPPQPMGQSFPMLNQQQLFQVLLAIQTSSTIMFGRKVREFYKENVPKT